MSTALRKLLPKQIRSHLKKLYFGLLDSQEWDRDIQRYPGLGWYIHPKAYQNRLRLQHFKDLHKGGRCFIIGNGPSLNSMSLTPLRNEFCFGLNRIYLLFPKLDFQTSYYISVNRLVIEQTAEDICSLSMPKFISWHARHFTGFMENIFYIRDAFDGTDGFAENPTWRIWEGATVTYVAMQLAFFMGFEQVILIGVDHSFVTQGEPNKEITSQSDDPNHFNPAYFGKGFRWQLPDLKTSERSYLLAKKTFELHNREILDATVGGKLNVFPKVDFESLF